MPGEFSNAIIAADPTVVESFLGTVASPPAVLATNGLVDSAFRAIMFTDLSDFTSTTPRIGDASAMTPLRGHNHSIRDAQVWVREVKHARYGLMASFKSVSDAGRCTREIQRPFLAYDKARAGQGMQSGSDSALASQSKIKLVFAKHLRNLQLDYVPWQSPTKS